MLSSLTLFTWLATAAAPVPRANEGPLTLKLAIAEALAASPALRAPEDGRTLAAIRERQAGSQLGVKITPTFQTGTDPLGLGQRTVGVSIAKQLPFGTDLQLTATSYQYGTGADRLTDAGYTFAISQPLLRGWTSAAAANRTQARRAIVAADRAYAESRQQLVVSVADAFFSVLRLQRLVDTGTRSLDRARQLHATSQARSTVGLATELDVLRADLLAAQASATLVSQREALESAVDTLDDLLGRPSGSPLALADDGLAEIVSIPAEPVEAFVRDALDHRLDVQESRDRIGDARRQESVARWNVLPPVNLDLSYTKRGLGAAGSPFEQVFGGWRVGLSTSYALDRGDETAALATAAVSVRAAERDAADTERRIADDVRRAYRSWTRTAETLDIQSKAVALAERQLRLANLRYERGVADNFDVIDAESNLFQAQSGLLAAQVERALAGLTLRRVTGTLNPDAFLS